MDSIRIIWLGHSCFMISADGYDIVIDPYDNNTVRGLAPITGISADEVLCSHSHGDHGAAHLIKIRGIASSIASSIAPIASYDIDSGSSDANAAVKKSPFTVKKLNSYHDDVKGTKKGKNIIHKISFNGVNIVHFGDIGCMPDDDTASEIRHSDVIMIPVGGYYTIDAAEAKKIADMTDAKIAIPMHYRSETFGSPVLSELDDFTRLCGNAVYYENNYIDITKNTKSQTAVLRYISPKL